MVLAWPLGQPHSRTGVRLAAGPSLYSPVNRRVPAAGLPPVPVLVQQRRSARATEGPVGLPVDSPWPRPAAGEHANRPHRRRGLGRLLLLGRGRGESLIGRPVDRICRLALRRAEAPPARHAGNAFEERPRIWTLRTTLALASARWIGGTAPHPPVRRRNCGRAHVVQPKDYLDNLFDLLFMALRPAGRHQF